MTHCGIFISGNLGNWNTHYIDTSNTVNGKPIYYWKNLTGVAIPPNAGEVILVNCSNEILESQNISDASVGIEIGFSSNITVANNSFFLNSKAGIYIYSSTNLSVINNTVSNCVQGIYVMNSNLTNIVNNSISNNGPGIYLSNSNMSVIANNNVSNNDRSIYLEASNNNLINGNDIENNTYGIWLDSLRYMGGSNNNTITENIAVSNWYCGIMIEGSYNNYVFNNYESLSTNIGIIMYNSHGNKIYHNNIMNNINQAMDNTNDNYWNDTYPSGGNYWSDYNGTDVMSGSSQDLPGSDGIGDTPYTNFYGGVGAQDNYPLMAPVQASPANSTFFKIPVTVGWNLISIPLIPTSTVLSNVLTDKDGDTIWDRVQWYDPCNTANHWKQYNTGWSASLNDLWIINQKMGVWINITTVGDGFLNVSGYIPTSTTISLKTGWNMVGYPSLCTNMTVANALWGTGATMVEVFDPNATYRTKTVGPTYVMRPGEGYWIYVPADTVWIVDW